MMAVSTIVTRVFKTLRLPAAREATLEYMPQAAARECAQGHAALRGKRTKKPGYVGYPGLPT